MIFLTRIHGEPVVAQFIHHPGIARKRRVLIATIQQEVASHFGLHPDYMKSKCRDMDVARPRQIAMYLARELTDKSLSQIGRYFGNKDHTTVLHAIRVVQNRICTSVKIAGHVEALRERLAA